MDADLKYFCTNLLGHLIQETFTEDLLFMLPNAEYSHCVSLGAGVHFIKETQQYKKESTFPLLGRSSR